MRAAFQWDGDTVSMEQERHRNGMATQYQWNKSGIAMECEKA